MILLMIRFGGWLDGATCREVRRAYDRWRLRIWAREHQDQSTHAWGYRVDRVDVCIDEAYP